VAVSVLPPGDPPKVLAAYDDQTRTLPESCSMAMETGTRGKSRVGDHFPWPEGGAAVEVWKMLKVAQLDHGPRFPASVRAVNLTYRALVASKMVVLVELLSW